MRRGYSGYRRAQLHLLQRNSRPLSTRDGRLLPPPGRYAGEIVECAPAAGFDSFTAVVSASGSRFRVRVGRPLPSGMKLDIELAWVGDTEIYIGDGDIAVVRGDELLRVCDDVGAALEYCADNQLAQRKFQIVRWRVKRAVDTERKALRTPPPGEAS